MKFVYENDVLTVKKGCEKFLYRLRPYIMTEEDCKTYLEYVMNDGQTARFEASELEAFVELTLVPMEHSTVLRIKAGYHPEHYYEKKFNNHFCLEHAVGVDVAAFEDTEAITVIHRRSEWWSRVDVDYKAEELPENSQALLLKRARGYGFVMALCDEKFKCNFVGNKEGGFSIYVWDNTYSNDCDTAAVAFGFGDDIYALPSLVIADGFEAVGRPRRMRNDREFPKELEYLGWCSWDAFHLDVSHEGLMAKAEELKEKEIPVKWLMIDDMWGHVKNNKLGVNSSRELYSFEADPVRFPKGLKGAVADIKEHYPLLVGLWHPTTGYWNGIDPQGEIAADPNYKDLINWSQEGMLVHQFDEDKIKEYYLKQHQFYADCGIDMIKVDNQACARRFAKRVMPIGQAARNLHRAIEESADTYFNGQLINCMGHPLENFWNRNSAVSRMSCDFDPGNRERFNLLIMQNSFNGMVQGSVYYGDWDMWWSYDSQAMKNAACHAISGGPVYVSDELGQSKREVIMPLVFSDGRVIRMENPALPVAQCLFENVVRSEKPFKIFNNDGQNGVVVAYNTTPDGRKVTGSISPKDAGLQGADKYCAYDRFTGEVIVVGKDEEIAISLEQGDDFKMILFVPMVEAKAVIGLKDKYVCFAGIKGGVALDDGELLVYETGRGLYSIPVKKDEIVQ